MLIHLPKRLFLSLTATSALLIPFGANGAAPNFDSETVDDDVAIGYGIAIEDVDGDGKEDIILADKREFRWYQNPTWKPYLIAKNLTLRDNVCVAARDLDGDGKAEIAVGANWNPGETSNRDESGSVHFLVRPDDPTTAPWKPVKLPHDPEYGIEGYKQPPRSGETSRVVFKDGLWRTEPFLK